MLTLSSRSKASDRLSVWRSPLKTYASSQVNHSYNLDDRGAERVARLLVKEQYIYPGDIMQVSHDSSLRAVIDIMLPFRTVHCLSQSLTDIL